MDKNNKNPLDWYSNILEDEVRAEEITIDLNDEYFLDKCGSDFLDIADDFTQNE